MHACILVIFHAALGFATVFSKRGVWRTAAAAYRLQQPRVGGGAGGVEEVPRRPHGRGAVCGTVLRYLTSDI